MSNHLTVEQRKLAVEALAKLKGCPACGTKDMSVEDIVLVSPFWDDAVHSGADSIAMLQVICKHCFHIMHFAAKPMGLLS